MKRSSEAVRRRVFLTTDFIVQRTGILILRTFPLSNNRLCGLPIGSIEARIGQLTWHDWRRTLAGDLIDQGDLAGAQLTLGQTSPSVRMRHSRREMKIVEDVLGKRPVVLRDHRVQPPRTRRSRSKVVKLSAPFSVTTTLSSIRTPPHPSMYMPGSIVNTMPSSS